MLKVVTFGEIMLRLAPEGYERFVQSEKFTAIYGGGEVNVAISLLEYDIPAAFVTKLPDNPIGQSAINSLRKFGVDTKHIIRGGERIGLYYIEKGMAQRPPRIVYDRKHSSIAEAEPQEFEWKTIFQEADWFHISGITPAISANGRTMALESMKMAKQMGLTVSFDSNYRSNLWTLAEARECMCELVKYADVYIGGPMDADKMFDITARSEYIVDGQYTRESYIDICQQLVGKYGFKSVAMTMRGSISASDNTWSAMLYTDEQAYFAKEYRMHIVDRVGGGDSFASGLLYGLIKKLGGQQTIEFATAASCLKHSIEGDVNRVTVAEVQRLMQGDGSGRLDW